MSSLNLAFSVVAPIFLMMALGYFLATVKIFSPPLMRQLNSLCFRVFFPISLFSGIYKSDLSTAFSPKLTVFAVASVCLLFVLLMITVPRLIKNRRDRGVVIQGILRSNYISFGLPVTASLCGSENMSVSAVLLPFVILLFNAFAAIALETCEEQRRSKSAIAKGVFKNPLIISSVSAFILVLTGIRLPSVIASTIADIGKVATPLALITLGGSFTFKNLGHSSGPLIFSVLGKLLLVPLIFIPLSVLFGFRGAQMVALLCLFASPTSVSSYAMAQSADANDELALQIVVTTSAFSIVTMFIFITALKALSLI